jgi:RNA polymerase sigma-B factor
MKTTPRSTPSQTVPTPSLLPAPGEQEQRLAFVALTEAGHALRTFLHGCGPVAQHMLALATECASGAAGTKNIAKKFFEPAGLDASKVLACRAASCGCDHSEALHALNGKPALYAECLQLAKEAVALDSGGLGERLESLEACYVTRRNSIVRDNLRLAASVVKRFGTRAMTEEDLLQHAAIGLQKAVETFKPTLGNKFSTYAVAVIHGELVRTCENSSHQVRLPSHVWGKMRKYNETRERLAAQLGRAPTRTRLAAELGITLREEAELQQYHWEPVSMSSPLSDGPEAMTLGDTLADDGTQAPGVESGDYADFIAPFSADLDGTERCILRKWVGDGPCLQMAKEDIAAELGLTVADVTRKLLNGLSKVKQRKESASMAA